MNFEQIYEDSHKESNIDFNKLYESAHEESFFDWYDTYNSKKLKESVIQEAKDCESIPHERMSKVYRIFESYVDDEEWLELRETIIDLENLEKKIFHQGFEFALKEDQSKILENYAKSYTFDTSIHLVESYDSVELWNNDKRRKELDAERKNPLIKKKIFESLNDEWLKDEVKNMIQHITEAGAVNFTPEQQELKDSIKNMNNNFTVKFKQGKPILFDKATRKRVDIKTLPKSPEKSAIIKAFKKFEASQSTAAPSPTPAPTPNPSPSPAPTVSKEKEVVDFIEELQISVDKKNNDYKDPAKYAALASSVSLADIKPFTWEKISAILLNKFKNTEQETAKAAFASGGTANKLDKQLKGIDKKAAKKFYDISSQEIRLQMLKSMNQAEIANDPALIAEMKELEKKNSTLGRLKSKVLNFIRQKAPILGKIISFAGAAFGIATKFGTITAIFAPLGPLAPVIALVVSVALFFIQKAIFNLAGKVTDVVVDKLFRDFLGKFSSKRGPIGLICKKLSSPNAVTITKLIVRVITTMLIAKPTANMLTGMVQKLSGPMISGLGAIGVTAETASRLIPDGIEGKLNDINAWAEGKAPPPIDPDKKGNGKMGPGLINQTEEQKAISNALKDIPPSGAGGPELPASAGAEDAGQVIRIPGQPTQYSAEWIRINNPNQATAGKDIGSGIWKSLKGENWDFEPVPGKEGFFTAKKVPDTILRDLISQGRLTQSGEIPGTSIDSSGSLIPSGAENIQPQTAASLVSSINATDGLDATEISALEKLAASSNPVEQYAASQKMHDYLEYAVKNNIPASQITSIADNNPSLGAVISRYITTKPEFEYLQKYEGLVKNLADQEALVNANTANFNSALAEAEKLESTLDGNPLFLSAMKKQMGIGNWQRGDIQPMKTLFTQLQSQPGFNTLDPSSITLDRTTDNLLVMNNNGDWFGIAKNGAGNIDVSPITQNTTTIDGRVINSAREATRTSLNNALEAQAAAEKELGALQRP
jgi:hypothetical protein